MKLYPDSMEWIYFFEKNPKFFAEVADLMLRSRTAGHQFFSSHLVRAEVLVIPKRNQDLFTTAKYRRFFQPPEITMMPFTSDVAERFSDLRAVTRVKPADALQLAFAASAGVDWFITHDTKLHSLTVPGIGRICSPVQIP